MADTTYMGDGESHMCHISFSWPCYGLGQFFNGHVHLPFEVAGLGVLNCGLGCIDWFHSGAWPFSSVDDSESVLKFFDLSDSTSALASSSSVSIFSPPDADWGHSAF